MSNHSSGILIDTIGLEWHIGYTTNRELAWADLVFGYNEKCTGVQRKL
jgi:hypothetical protein